MSDQPKTYAGVMVSSTFVDLENHRVALFDALAKQGLHPVGMETNTPRPGEDVIAASLRMVREGAAYILLIAHRLGQVPDHPDNPHCHSITRLEFEEALRLGRPVHVFIMGEDHPVLPRFVDDKTGPLADKLNDFRAKAKASRIYDEFNSYEEFTPKAVHAASYIWRELNKQQPRPPVLQTAAPPTPITNISIPIPTHFLGRDTALAEIHAALQRPQPRVAITALHGMRCVGKTVLAAAYATRHQTEYRATWWLRAATPDTLRQDLVALGIRLGWLPPDAKEAEALPRLLARLRDDGDGILLIYDNAIDANSIAEYLPQSGPARILVTSNSPAWRALAHPVQIETWPHDIGADYLIARTGQAAERAAAEALSETLGGLPLAHEMAAAYCEEAGITIAAYAALFAATPLPLLDDPRAPGAYHDGTTVARAFTLAIKQATKRHPAAGPLIAHAALLAPEPIPLFLFAEARTHLGEPLATDLDGLGLDNAIAALRAFALITREAIPDERDPNLLTDSIRLHRLVRTVAAASLSPTDRPAAQSRLLEALAATFPDDAYDNPATWPRARRLDPLALALAAEAAPLPAAADPALATLLNSMASFRQGPRAAYVEARLLFARALAIRERALGPDHPDIATSLNNLAFLLQVQGDLTGARLLFNRALQIRERALGADHPYTALSLNNLALLLEVQGDLGAARSLTERALAIRVQAFGPVHPDTAASFISLAVVLRAQGDLPRA